MITPDIIDGSTAGATQTELNDGHRKANSAVVQAIKLEKEGLLAANPRTIPDRLKEAVEEARETLGDLDATARGGTE